MPVYALTDELLFPPPHLATPDGLLAVGGDLSVDRLLLAYSKGIFPWYSEGDPILWWSPEPRVLLFPDEFKMSRSFRQVVNSGRFEIRFDTAFRAVITACAETRGPGREETWITDEMLEAYCALHDAGFAHSVEAWREDELAGGLYGVSLGAAFFGESMFTRQSNASKVAMAALVDRARAWDFRFIDCQMKTEHLMRLGAQELPRRDFLVRLGESLRQPTRRGSWQHAH